MRGWKGSGGSCEFSPLKKEERSGIQLETSVSPKFSRLIGLEMAGWEGGGGLLEVE